MTENKTLSQELCELCGIEPRWVKYKAETTDECINYGSKLIYPDFEKPVNFVKLFNLKFITCLGEERTIAYHITKIFVNTKDTEEFIKQVIHQLKTSFDKTQIKRAIAAQEWEY